MTYATASDVQTLLARELTTEETVLVDRRLAQVERMILRRIPDLVAQIDAGDLDAEDLTDIEAEAVLRVVRNPDGLASETDGNYGYVKSADAADNSLRITAEEWQRLGIKPSRMYSIVPNLVARVGSSSFGTGG